MKRTLAGAAGILLAMLVVTGTARAEDLRGRFALYAKVGVINPADAESSTLAPGHQVVVSSDPGPVFGGGLLYGLDDNVAFELEITRSTFHTSDFGDAEIKDLSVGGQYRFPERARLAPYLGGGVDVLINDLDGPRISAVDTVLGVHLCGGVDYFATRQFVLNAELRGVEAFSANVNDLTGGKVGSFDPSNLTFSIGVRIFFN